MSMTVSGFLPGLKAGASSGRQQVNTGAAPAR